MYSIGQEAQSKVQSVMRSEGGHRIRRDASSISSFGLGGLLGKRSSLCCHLLPASDLINHISSSTLVGSRVLTNRPLAWELPQSPALFLFFFFSSGVGTGHRPSNIIGSLIIWSLSFRLRISCASLLFELLRSFERKSFESLCEPAVVGTLMIFLLAGFEVVDLPIPGSEAELLTRICGEGRC